jgi:hypothetical protein
MINKKKWVPGHNCKFNLAKGGRLTILPTMDFNGFDYKQTFKLVELHAKYKKIKRPEEVNKWWKIPTLMEAA